MSNNNPDDRLKMHFPSNNQCWRSCGDKCCSWGQRARPIDQNGNIRGQTAPLWKNPAKTFFKVVCALAFILGILFVIAFIIIKYKNDDILEDAEEEQANDNDRCIIKSEKKLKPIWIVIGAILIFMNAFCYCFIGCKTYASDQDWSRYLIVTSFFVVVLIGVNIAQYVITIKNLDLYNNDEIFKTEGGEDKDQCKNLFKANLIINFIVAGLSTIIEIMVIIRIIFIAKDFFMTKYVKHDAKCIDDDIIIIE